MTDLSYLPEHLYGQAEIIKSKHDAAREKMENDETKACTFKPFLYKSGKGIRPSYRSNF